ncbi:hypothetical protein [Hydrogenophaga sp.]|uniref:hypothetical protein n=1 Tax=Hydrogenophaga sp. TaxID=1904254 RepID=UPI0027258120|nr:hypothetical protein [Hydrogenophaga sp.]MDO9433821.1 hypothetical protein [Hydrogenophaga sp.]
MRLLDALRSKTAGNKNAAQSVKTKGTSDDRSVETATPAKRRGLSSIAHFFRTRLIEKSSTTNGPRANAETRHSAKLADAILKSATAPFNKMAANSSVALRPTMTEDNFKLVRENAAAFVEAVLPMGQHGANVVETTLDAYFEKESAGRNYQPLRLAALSALSDALQNCADKENPVVTKLSNHVNEQFLTHTSSVRNGGFGWDNAGEKEWGKLSEAATSCIRRLENSENIPGLRYDVEGLVKIRADADQKIDELKG